MDTSLLGQFVAGFSPNAETDRDFTHGAVADTLPHDHELT